MEAIRQLWEETPLSATMIAQSFGTTKGTIERMASKKGWKRGERADRAELTGEEIPLLAKIPVTPTNIEPLAPRTLNDRLTELHLRLDWQLGLDDSGGWEGPRWRTGKREEPEGL